MGVLMKKYIITFNLILVMILISLSAWARWTKKGGDVIISYYCVNPSLAMFNGTPYVAWQEKEDSQSSQIHVSHYNGSAWVPDGRLNVGEVIFSCAENPSLNLYNGLPHVAWQENDTVGRDQIYVKHHNGTGWIQDGDRLNINPSYDGCNPSLAVYNDVQYVAWAESNGSATQIYVKYHNPYEVWLQAGGSLNWSSLNNGMHPSLACNNGTPYVAWQEDRGYYNHIFVKHYVGGNWVQDGGCLNVSIAKDAAKPSLAILNGTPYVAWSENDNSGVKQIYVKHYDGSNWVPDGGSLNINSSDMAYEPCLVISGGMLYVAWREFNGSAYKVYVKHYTGSNWVQDGNGLNNGTYDEFSFAVYNGVPYIAQKDESGAISQMCVKYWAPDYISSVVPNYCLSGQTVQITIAGIGFDPVPTAKLILSGHPDIVSTSYVCNSLFSYTYTFNLNGATAGLYDVQVTTTDECTSFLKYAFSILEPVANPTWVVNDLGTPSGITQTADYCGLTIGDVDDDGKQELYAATDSLYQYKRYAYAWSVNSMTSVSGPFSGVVLADGDKDQAWEAYGITLGNQVHQYDTGAWTDTNLGTGGMGATALYAVTQADVNQDGIMEIYAAGDNGAVCQYSHTGSAWSKLTISNSPAYTSVALTSGDGNNDFKAECYSANTDKKIYQYAYTSGVWTIVELGMTFPGQVTSLAVGDGNRDGVNEIYAACQDGRVYQCRWNGSGWVCGSIGEAGGSAMRGVIVSDGDNDGTDEVYAACLDGRLYRFVFSSGQWTTSALNDAGTPLYAVAAGDADNDHHFEVYALGQNNHVYQFQAVSAAAPTPTATATLNPTPLPPQKFLKIYHSQINPLYNEQAAIQWTQPQTGPVSVAIYNLLGDKIITLLDHQNYSAGEYHKITWDGRNKHGKIVGSGIYIVHLKADVYQERGKIAVVK